MKIQIIGYSGSGKSTFAQRISDIYNVKLLHMDTIYFNPDWKPKTDDEVFAALNSFMSSSEWIIDGSYQRFLGDKRAQEADLIYIFKFNRFRCLINVVKRRMKYRNTVRNSAAEGCKEKLDFKFVMWILKDGRSKRHKQRQQEIISNFPDKVTLFKNHKQVNKYLESIMIK